MASFTCIDCKYDKPETRRHKKTAVHHRQRTAGGFKGEYDRFNEYELAKNSPEKQSKKDKMVGGVNAKKKTNKIVVAPHTP